jgi:hypothetical protein
MEGTEQVGAAVHSLGEEPLAPGETARALIIPMVPSARSLRQQVKADDELRMLEGGIGSVERKWETDFPFPPEHEDRSVAWVNGRRWQLSSPSFKWLFS